MPTYDSASDTPRDPARLLRRLGRRPRRFLVYDSGYRQLRLHLRGGRPRRARLCGATAHGRPRARATRSIWSENRPEWIVALLGLPPRGRGRRADGLPRVGGLLRRVRGIVRPAGPRRGRRPARPPARPSRPRASGRSPDLDGAPTRPQADAAITRDDVAEDHLHVGRHRRSQGRRRSPIGTCSRTSSPSSARCEVPQVRAAVPPDPVPEPAAAQPHVRPVDGDVRAADARAAPSSFRTATTRPRSCGRSRRGGSRCWLRAEVLDVLREHILRRFAAAAEPPAGKALRWRWWRYRGVHRLFGWKFWASSSAPRRSIRNSKRSGASWASWSCRATA